MTNETDLVNYNGTTDDDSINVNDTILENQIKQELDLISSPNDTYTNKTNTGNIINIPTPQPPKNTSIMSKINNKTSSEPVNKIQIMPPDYENKNKYKLPPNTTGKTGNNYYKIDPLHPKEIHSYIHPGMLPDCSACLNNKRLSGPVNTIQIMPTDYEYKNKYKSPSNKPQIMPPDYENKNKYKLPPNTTGKTDNNYYKIHTLQAKEIYSYIRKNPIMFPDLYACLNKSNIDIKDKILDEKQKIIKVHDPYDIKITVIPESKKDIGNIISPAVLPLPPKYYKNDDMNKPICTNNSLNCFYANIFTTILDKNLIKEINSIFNLFKINQYPTVKDVLNENNFQKLNNAIKGLKFGPETISKISRISSNTNIIMNAFNIFDLLKNYNRANNNYQEYKRAISDAMTDKILNIDLNTDVIKQLINISSDVMKSVETKIEYNKYIDEFKFYINNIFEIYNNIKELSLNFAYVHKKYVNQLLDTLYNLYKLRIKLDLKYLNKILLPTIETISMELIEISKHILKASFNEDTIKYIREEIRSNIKKYILDQKDKIKENSTYAMEMYLFIYYNILNKYVNSISEKVSMVKISKHLSVIKKSLINALSVLKQNIQKLIKNKYNNSIMDSVKKQFIEILQNNNITVEVFRRDTTNFIIEAINHINNQTNDINYILDKIIETTDKIINDLYKVNQEKMQTLV
jgi:hypothetical protein